MNCACNPYSVSRTGCKDPCWHYLLLFCSSLQQNLMPVIPLVFQNILPARRWMQSYGMKKLEGGLNYFWHLNGLLINIFFGQIQKYTWWKSFKILLLKLSTIQWTPCFKKNLPIDHVMIYLVLLLSFFVHIIIHFLILNFCHVVITHFASVSSSCYSIEKVAGHVCNLNMFI